MSLADAVLEIATDMEAPYVNRNDTLQELAAYAKQLRRAVRAAESPHAIPQGGPPPAAVDPLVAHRLNIERAKGERVAKAADREDAAGEVSVRCVGGSLDKTMLVLPGAPPAGAFLPQGDEVYQYGEDRSLHYHAAQTERFRRERKK